MENPEFHDVITRRISSTKPSTARDAMHENVPSRLHVTPLLETDHYDTRTSVRMNVIRTSRPEEDLARVTKEPRTNLGIITQNRNEVMNYIAHCMQKH